jgi:hypothetical protein
MILELHVLALVAELLFVEISVKDNSMPVVGVDEVLEELLV